MEGAEEREDSTGFVAGSNVVSELARRNGSPTTSIAEGGPDAADTPGNGGGGLFRPNRSARVDASVELDEGNDSVEELPAHIGPGPRSWRCRSRAASRSARGSGVGELPYFAGSTTMGAAGSVDTGVSHPEKGAGPVAGVGCGFGVT